VIERVTEPAAGHLRGIQDAGEEQDRSRTEDCSIEAVEDCSVDSNSAMMPVGLLNGLRNREE